jgi:hypothetical protein
MKKLLLLVMLTLSMSLTAGTNENSFDKTVNKTEQGISTIYNDGKDLTKTVYGDLKEVAPKIESAITEVAKGLKVGAENVWQILVKQQKVWSIAFLLLTISALINWYMFYKRYLYKPTNKDIEFTVLERDIVGDIPNPEWEKLYADDKYWCDKNDIRTIQTIKGSVGKEQYNAPKVYEIPESNFNAFVKFIHLVICCILSFYSVLHFGDMLTGFINPEFGAMKMLFETAQTLK